MVNPYRISKEYATLIALRSTTQAFGQLLVVFRLFRSKVVQNYPFIVKSNFIYGKLDSIRINV